MLNRKGKKIGAVLLTMVMALGLLTGCGGNSEQKDGSAKAENTSVKVFTYGDTTFNAENDESDVNPHRGYSGWACIRYGIGETLFKYSDSMELEPWLAKSYENVDDNMEDYIAGQCDIFQWTKNGCAGSQRMSG